MYSFRARALSACVLWLSTVLSSWAADSLPPAASQKPLTLRDAVTATLNGNPNLKVFTYSLRVQDARVQQAGLRPAPEVSAELENAFGTGELRGLDAAESTFSLAQVIELGGKRSGRVASAQIGRETVTIEQQAAQLDVLAEVTRRLIHVAGDQEQLALTRQATVLARRTADAVKRRVEAAKSPEVELHRANVELMRTEIELRHAEHELIGSRRQLAAMWAAPTDDFGEVIADLYDLPAPADFDVLVARMAANPDFTRFASQARLRDAEARMAQLRRTPDVRVSVGVRRFEEADDHALLLGLSLPLFSGAQAAPAIAEAQALRAESDAERDAAFIKARAQVFDLYQELRHSIAETEILKRDALPQIEEALRETEYAYDRGRYSYIELVDGQRAYLDVQRSLIKAATNVHTVQAEIERLTGEPLAATTNTREAP